MTDITSPRRPTRRAFLGASAAALLLTACGGAPAAPTSAPAAAAQPADAWGKPAAAGAKPAAAGAKPAAGGTPAPAAAAPVQAAAKGLVLEMSFPDWIIDV